MPSLDSASQREREEAPSEAIRCQPRCGSVVAIALPGESIEVWPEAEPEAALHEAAEPGILYAGSHAAFSRRAPRRSRRAIAESRTNIAVSNRACAPDTRRVATSLSGTRRRAAQTCRPERGVMQCLNTGATQRDGGDRTAAAPRHRRAVQYADNSGAGKNQHRLAPVTFMQHRVSSGAPGDCARSSLERRRKWASFHGYTATCNVRAPSRERRCSR